MGVFLSFLFITRQRKQTGELVEYAGMTLADRGNSSVYEYNFGHVLMKLEVCRK